MQKIFIIIFAIVIMPSYNKNINVKILSLMQEDKEYNLPLIFKIACINHTQS